MKEKGILILSHVGFSFVDQLASQISNEGIERYILSSKPEDQNNDRISELKTMGEWFNSTEQHQLCWDDVLNTIKQLQSDNINVVACISVWEGYRGLMALANEYLGIKDITNDCVSLLTNKFELRKKLFQHGLSNILVEPLTEKVFNAYQQQAVAKFIKPFRGIASFGTFKLTAELCWNDIITLQQQLKEDVVYNGIFAAHDPFIIEDYIHGNEFSFEILVEDGSNHIVAIHEKSEVSQEKMTTLENACVCPPISLTAGDVSKASHWLDEVFLLLNINSGCFHVEAKYDNGQWEIIEINPRVGGSFISQSVEHFTNGHSLVNLWIKLLLQSTQEDAQYSQLLASLSVTGANLSPNQKATFFRVFYGEVGTVSSVEQEPGRFPPLMTQVFVKEGDCFSVSHKENFVGQALWALDAKQLMQSYRQISQQSDSLIKVTYEPLKYEVERKALLIVDFNLSRSEDVAHIKAYTDSKYAMDVVLIRSNPSKNDLKLADVVIDLDPLEPNFVIKALTQIYQLPYTLKGGLVFSDNAVHSGARLLTDLGLLSDCAELSENAFCKYQYRLKEQQCKKMLVSQRVFVPNMEKITTVDSLETFISNNPKGIVVKPTTEGNNRGVILLQQPNSKDVTAVLEEVKQYIKGGVIAEQMIPFSAEFSYDGIGNSSFITEKFNLSGRYPVEYAQLVPADLSSEQVDLINRTGQIANMIVGQDMGPFHNEVRVSDDYSQAAVIEANRRPAGMKIWSLAGKVFEQDLYNLWVDSVINQKKTNIQLKPKGSAMSIMLPASESGFVLDILPNIKYLFEELQAQFARNYTTSAPQLNWMSCETIAHAQQYIHVPPRDNSDFIALITVSAVWPSSVMKQYLPAIQASWDQVLNHYIESLIETTKKEA